MTPQRAAKVSDILKKKKKNVNKNERLVGSCGFFYFLQYPDPNRNKDPRPNICYLVIGLSSPQLCSADYESSCAQNMSSTTHTHSYIQNIYTLYSKEQ